MKIKTKSSQHNAFIKSISVIAVGLLILASPSAYAQKKDKLLGEKNFDVELTEQGKKKPSAPVKDQILFRAEKLSSTYMMREFVFTASSYTASVDSTSGTSIITFASDSKNADGDLLKWSGKVQGENMDGTAIITDKKGKSKAEFTFKGQMKKFRK